MTDPIADSDPMTDSMTRPISDQREDEPLLEDVA